ncbi:MAG: peptidoglycan DD-metalloendopeptidase family protein [Chloroflexi bacterium]|nr:peptidoglycan DD-metalloendopeptidase family protein [Chloroflexota bacterium]
MMKNKNGFLSISTFSLIWLLFIFILSACQSETPTTVIQQPKLVITPDEMSPIEKEIAEAFEESITGREDVLSFLIYDVNIDSIDINAKKNRALIWLSLSDPATGELIASETGLAIAQKQTDSKSRNPWKITLQADADWEKVLNSLPKKLIDDETKERFSSRQQSIPHAAKVYTGYRLPWETGESKRLSGSIGHVYLYKSCPTTCLYAFDFYDGTMWPILAAKGGRVKYAVWQYPNGNTKHANYIVLEDTTTNPTTYQVYMHLAQDSIPVALRTPGAKVVQGQKIGIVDDTGYSTGHHLHFHVHTNSASYWGSSVDIVFDEVKVNGGRPRTCNEANLFPSLGKSCQTGDLYVSKNNDYNEPTGKISSPADETMITGQTVEIKGKVADDSGIQSLQVQINYDGNWITASDVPVSEINKKGNFTTTIDLCELEVPDGDFFVALNIIDKASKSAVGTPGLRTLTKQYTCPLPPPKCTATSTQIGLFEKPDFQGECVLLDPGSYDLTGEPVTIIDTLGSIQIGSDVISQFTTADNQYPVIGDLTHIDGAGFAFTDIQTILVESRPPVPQSQTIYVDDQTEGDELTSDAPITVSWEILDASLEYRATLLQDDKVLLQQDWSKTNKWEISGLELGGYKLTLEIHNLVGDAVSSIDFIVQEPDVAPITSLDDLPEVIDSASFTISWAVTEGLDDLQYVEIRYSENDQEWQMLGNYPAQITSTVFTGNHGSSYQFQIRGVDLAGNSEEFHSGNASSVTLSLSCTPDDYDLNSEGDNSFQSATALVMSISQEHNICDIGDHDYFTFSAEKDTNYRITVNPSTSAGSMNLKLLDPTLSEIIAESTSVENGGAASLVWTAPESTTYYVDISASNSEIYGDQTSYQIKIDKSVQLTSPGIVVPAILTPVLLSLLAMSRKFLHIFKK